jgi:polysaccharide pyruvyl transferase
MKKVILFDPSYATSNLGDFIINEAVMRQMDFVFSNNFLVRYSSHTPLLHVHQNIRKNLIKENCNQNNLKFLGGSNLLKYNLLVLMPDWNINIFTKNLYKGSISLGCGVANNSRKLNLYTKYIYKTTLSKNFVHSTRDEETKEFLERLGFKAINTGCPTLWDLNTKFCKTLPKVKAKNVVFTLTDYETDAARDQKLIDTLVENYDIVHFWIQGIRDLDYFRTLQNTEKIKLVGPSVLAYKNILLSGDIDYVGTRLHAGIFAMQHKVRSIILIVDNRARDMQKTYNINAIERDNIDDLGEMIRSEFTTDIKIDEDKIKLWKSQFANYGK